MCRVILFTGSWVHCNDAKMETTSIDKVMSSQAYILFYTQRPPAISNPQVAEGNVNKTSTTPASSASQVAKGLRLFDQKADEEITFNYQNSTIPKFLELKRKLSGDHSGRMVLKKRKSTLW